MPSAQHPDIRAMAQGFSDARKAESGLVSCGINAVAAVAEAHGTISPDDVSEDAPPATDASVIQSTPGRRPPPVVEAEKAAAAAVAKAGGPLSWSELIGATEAATAAPQAAPARPAPSVSTPVAPPPVSAPPVPGSFSWADVIGIAGGDSMPYPQQPAAPSTPSAPPAPPAVEPEAPKKLDPMSWEEIIGGGGQDGDK